jgi:hypothetical protein
MNPKPILHMSMVAAAVSSSSGGSRRGGRGAAGWRHTGPQVHNLGKAERHELQRRCYKRKGWRRFQSSRETSCSCMAPLFRPQPRTPAVPASISSSRCSSAAAPQLPHGRNGGALSPPKLDHFRHLVKSMQRDLVFVCSFSISGCSRCRRRSRRRPAARPERRRSLAAAARPVFVDRDLDE